MGILDKGHFDEVTKLGHDVAHNLATWPRQIFDMLGGRGGGDEGAPAPRAPPQEAGEIFTGNTREAGRRSDPDQKARIRAQSARDAEVFEAQSAGPDLQGIVSLTTFQREAEIEREGNPVFLGSGVKPLRRRLLFGRDETR